MPMRLQVVTWTVGNLASPAKMPALTDTIHIMSQLLQCPESTLWGTTKGHPIPPP